MSTATPEPSSSSERVDRATAVFRTLAPRTPEDDATAPEGGDRLKQAVAAWVATTDDPPTDAAGGGAGAGTAADATGTAAGADGEPGAEPGSGADAASGPEPASESAPASGPEPASESESAPGAKSGTEPKGGSGTETEPKPAPESGTTAPSEEPGPAEGAAGSAGDTRAAKGAKGSGSAVEGRTAAGDVEEPAEGTGATAGSAGKTAGASGTAAATAGDVEEPAEATGATAESTPKAPEAAGKAPEAPGEAREGSAEAPEASREAPARVGAGADPSEEPSGAGKAAGAPAASWFAPKKAEDSAEPEGDAKAEPKAAAPVDPRTGARPEPKADTAATKPAWAKQDTAPGAKSDAAPGAKPDATSGTKPGVVAGAKGGAAVEGGADESPVDQPTTMFRAVRPPVVDQPTTALKLPRTPGTDPDSERTSTFVPLRPDLPGAGASEPEAKTAVVPAPGPKAAKATPATATPATPAAGVNPALAEPERTRQQPLPPLPPLDLLAELTNTPPPPPSPWRTVLRRVRIWTPLVLILLIVFAIAQMVRPLPQPALALSAAPSFTFEGGELAMPWPTEGQGAVEVEGVGSMGMYGAQKPAPIASVTKTMTAYVILRDHPIKGKQRGPEITIDAKAAEQANAQHESTAAVREGQKYTQKELLQLLMIPSANNVARLLARWDAGSEQAFVDKMNAAAKDLGMTQSRYTDPSGLLDSTVSTPQDQLKLAKAVMQYDVFREIVNMPNVTVDGIPGRIENNNNILLKPGVSGIKTGSSTPAGGNLLWAANTVVDGENRRILGIVMGAKNAKVLNDKLQLSIDYSYELIKQAQKDVTSAVVVRKGQVVGYVDDGLGGRTPVVATKELKPVGWPGLKVKLELTDGGKTLPHTGRAGDVVGTVSVGEGAGKVSAPVALQADLAEPGFDKKLTRIS
ncbi:serine hydrolase [Streptomyces termitum]|uniref:D-alanyl-D-alanine carboxypeptidase n=1 Tax=Streptomyces termitum TaxID=67368 RepID=UPI001E44946E|nr:serine hydrolase [Streptomyces termitum]